MSTTVRSTCSKVAYHDKVAALLALADVQRRAESGEWTGPAASGKIPSRAYWCDRCGWWHLTSAEKREERP